MRRRCWCLAWAVELGCALTIVQSKRADSSHRVTEALGRPMPLHYQSAYSTLEKFAFQIDKALYNWQYRLPKISDTRGPQCDI